MLDAQPAFQNPFMHHHMNMRDAQELFNSFFQDFGFSSNPHSHAFHHGHAFHHTQQHAAQNASGHHSNFHNDFFHSNRGFNDSFTNFPSFGQPFQGAGFSAPLFGSMTSFSSSSNFGGGFVSSSTSTTTQVVNGRAVTRTVMRVQHADGRVEEKVTENNGSGDNLDFSSSSFSSNRRLR
jgi:hypothetical protein